MMDESLTTLVSNMSNSQAHFFQGLTPAATMPTPKELADVDITDKSDLRGWVLGVVIAAICLIVFIVSVRLLVRRFMTRHFFLDDLLVVVASLFTLVVCSVTLAGTNYGLGKHIWNLNQTTILDEVGQLVKLMLVGNTFYALAICFTKLSIITLYLRIFQYQNLRYFMYATMAVTIGLVLASVPATIFQCSPVSAAWDFTDYNAQCYPFIHFLYATSAINIATDIILCTVPLPFFWKLQLPRKQKIIVSILFIIGGFAAIANIIRISFLHYLNGFDVTYNLVSSLLWTIAECTIGIVCVSIPPIRPLFARLAPSIFVSRRRSLGTGIAVRRKSYALGRPTGHHDNHETRRESSNSQVGLTGEKDRHSLPPMAQQHTIDEEGCSNFPWAAHSGGTYSVVVTGGTHSKTSSGES